MSANIPRCITSVSVPQEVTDARPQCGHWELNSANPTIKKQRSSRCSHSFNTSTEFPFLCYCLFGFLKINLYLKLRKLNICLQWQWNWNETTGVEQLSIKVKYWMEKQKTCPQNQRNFQPRLWLTAAISNSFLGGFFCTLNSESQVLKSLCATL